MASTSSRRILEWTGKQSRILSGNGVAERLYEKNAFKFQKNELPHYHLEHGSWHDAAKASALKANGPSYTLGGFERPFFYGGGEWTNDDTCSNVQTSSLFVDIRKPAHFDQVISDDSLERKERLRLLARQHAFAGYTSWEMNVATRYHLIDWNWLGISGRKVPNRWCADTIDENTWRELSFARFSDGSPYYFEDWHRVADQCPRIAIVQPQKRAIFCLSGLRFAYAHDARTRTSKETSCAAAVDAALESGDYDAATDFVNSLRAGFGSFLPSSNTDPLVHDSLQPQHISLRLSKVLPGFDLPALWLSLFQASKEHANLKFPTRLVDFISTNHNRSNPHHTTKLTSLVGDVFGSDHDHLYLFEYFPATTDTDG